MEQFKAKKPTILSSYQVETLSDVMHVLRPDQIDAFQVKYPNRSVSVLLQEQVTANVSVEIPDMSADSIYDDVPIVKNIDFGVYPSPNRYGIEEYIMCVDNGGFGQHYHEDVVGYISSEAYISDHIPTLKFDPYSETSSLLSVYD